MTTHISLRLAWHNDGWNGRICTQPEKNTYCVGCVSYPGEKIREDRDLAWEKQNGGKAFAELGSRMPPCMFSASAFADRESEVYSEPPGFFNDDTETKRWTLPPATACIWPYEAMFNKPDVRVNNHYDYEKRLLHAQEYFKPIEAGKSLVFYYANYSNPLSDDKASRYVLIGVARIKKVDDILFYDNCSERTLERYKGFIWQCGVTSDYPEQGVRLPYHRYLDNPETLEKIAVFPENSSLCKYGTRHVSDDDALGLLEQLLESLFVVRDTINDDSENWDHKIRWVEGLIAEFWSNRGAYPGLPAVLQFLQLDEVISEFHKAAEDGKEQELAHSIKQFLNGRQNSLGNYQPSEKTLAEIRRTIKLRAGDHLDMLTDKLARINIDSRQLQAIMQDNRIEVGVTASLQEIAANPYLLSEQYNGLDGDDPLLGWSKVDRGMLPSPDLSAPELFKKNNAERLRALLLETLRGNQQQVFVSADFILSEVNRRIEAHPEWKREFITPQYLEVDEEFYGHAIHQHQAAGVNYLYDTRIWQDEQVVRTELNELLMASDIRLPRPVEDSFWDNFLYRHESSLASKANEEYKAAIEDQKQACKHILRKRISIITGGAGTGKSTVIGAIIKAIHKIHNSGSRLAIIAPTGKATDRLRSAIEDSDADISTVHSILARHGWLNKNMTFRLTGGRKLNSYSTIIIDESSMIDLSLMAALFRSIDWNSVARLILVGDPAQLPPIGVGKVFVDMVTNFQDKHPEHIYKLTHNLRQMVNRASNKGTGILNLASCFVNGAASGKYDCSPDAAMEREMLIQKIHAGGEIDQDLRIEYWDDPERLHENLIEMITHDLSKADEKDKRPQQIWGERLKDEINCMQILSPIRGELCGTESLNTEIQKFKSEYWLKKGNVDGITLFDKVIQTVNRPKSNPIKGFNFSSRSFEEVEVFNGEIGSVLPAGNDLNKFKNWNFRLTKLAVKFQNGGKHDINVNYFGSPSDRPENNLELAYAISIHKAQGSEFRRVYFVLPEASSRSQAMELLYTGLTRATEHCTVFVENDVNTLINAMRPDQSAVRTINSSLFTFAPVNEAMSTKRDWYVPGKIHPAIADEMLRCESEKIIANVLHEQDIDFHFEKPLIADDGTLYLPAFTIMLRGEEYYWEHIGNLSEGNQYWEKKKAWYDHHFPSRMKKTQGEPISPQEASRVIQELRML